MPFRRKSLEPCVARNSSRNISSVPAGTASSLVRTKAPICASLPVDVMIVIVEFSFISLSGEPFLYERRLAIDRIDYCHNAVDSVAQQELGMRHRGVQHRSGIGETCRFQKHAMKSAPAIVEVAQ